MSNIQSYAKRNIQDIMHNVQACRLIYDTTCITCSKAEGNQLSPALNGFVFEITASKKQGTHKHQTPPGITTPLATHRHMAHHGQACRNVTIGGPSHGHRGSAQQI